MLASSSVKVSQYEVRIVRDGVKLTLDSNEELPGVEGTHLAYIDYAPGAEAREFINRGGFLSIDRPLELYLPTIDLLRNENPTFFHADGSFSTSREPAGEGEDGLLDP
jgi:hypothetical protein